MLLDRDVQEFEILKQLTHPKNQGKNKQKKLLKKLDYLAEEFFQK